MTDILFRTQDGVDIKDGDSFYYILHTTGKISDKRIAKKENTPDNRNPKFKFYLNALAYRWMHEKT